jgi:ribulose-phosphate 3-epimerase
VIKIAPSVLAADFSCLYDEIKRVESEADLLHFDIMDGQFVPNITFGPVVIGSLRDKFNLPFEGHLMVNNPAQWIVPFARAGCNMITIHRESRGDPHQLIALMREEGVKAGVALNPDTSLDSLESILSEIHLVLIMTVNPGFVGQSFIGDVLPKIRSLRQVREEKSLSFEIAVDGGINEETAGKVVEAGASVLVAGTAIFHAPDPQKALLKLKEAGSGSKDSVEKGRG